MDKRFGDRAVLSSLDLEIGRGEFVALLGRSGSGKSTLLRILAGLDPAVEGEASVDGTVSVAFQQPRLLPWRRVWRNVVLGLHDQRVGASGARVGPSGARVGASGARVGAARGQDTVAGTEADGGGRPVNGRGQHVDGRGQHVDGTGQHVDGRGQVVDGRGKLGRGRDRALAEKALSEVHLEGHADAWPRTLSGGEAQRVSLARALVREPDLLLLDEPFGALDALTRLAMHRLVEDLWSGHRPGVLLVTHDVDEALLLADRVLVLGNGRIVSEHVLRRPRPRALSDHLEVRTDVLADLGVSEYATT
ncbi:ABC transporter ATP-binding protein [Amycolatopsis acidicola]|uniref:ABC transporter ATP-binding protein n=1 Tax=Amycolatopsis acidicola TaxID=2596893 RepID=UPI003C7A1750